MGTRADFYLGRGETAEWLGSIAWDGDPGGLDSEILKATTKEEFLRLLKEDISKRDDFTKPEDGWPWPWDDSHTTDYAYAFEDGKVWAHNHAWFDPLVEKDEDDDNYDTSESVKAVFPNMKKIQNVTFGKRSGVIIVGPKGPIDED